MFNEKQIFANRLNYYMAKNGKTQSDLVNDLSINKSTISTWCNGTKMPRMGTIQTLADYFSIMKSDLIEEKPATNNGELNELEKMFMDLPTERRDEVLRYMRYLVDQQEKSK